MNPLKRHALRLLKFHKHRLTVQQYKTLRGQALTGDALGAVKGLQRILNERGEPRANTT